MKPEKNILLFSLAKSVSLLGTSIYTFAIGLHVLKLTGSGTTFAINLVLATLPIVLAGPAAGVLSDKLNKKLLIVLLDLLNGALLFSVLLCSTLWGLNITVIYLSTFILSLFTTAFDTAIEAAIPSLVKTSRLMSINVAGRVISSAALLVGPALGGAIFAFVDIDFIILANAISFIFSGIAEIFIDFSINGEYSFNGARLVKMEAGGSEGKSTDQIGRTKQDSILNIEMIASLKGMCLGYLGDIREALGYMLSNRTIMQVFWVFVALNFCLGLAVTVPMPYILNRVLKLEPVVFGAIQAVFSIGDISGALLVKRLNERLDYRRTLRTASIILSICMGLMSLPLMIPGFGAGTAFYAGTAFSLRAAFLPIYYGLVMFILGAAIAFIDIPFIYLLQKDVKGDFRGRVLSLLFCTIKIVSPIALMFSGILVDVLPPFMLPLAGGLLLVVFICYNKQYSYCMEIGRQD